MGVVTGGVVGTAFHGGTITQPLTITDAIIGNLLEVIGTHTDLVVDGFGELVLTSDTAAQMQVNAGGVGQSATFSITGTDSGGVSFDTTAGVQVSVGGAHTLVAQPSQGSVQFGGFNAAINSAALLPGDFALWLDQTNGAAKLMVKAKTANGTVVTGSLALA